MIITTTAEGVNLDERTTAYVEKVIGSLERFIAKADRQTARANVTLRRIDQPHGNKYEAQVTVLLATTEISEKDTTLNVLAALDIVRAKIVAVLTQIYGK